MKTKRPADSQDPAACGSARCVTLWVTTKSSHCSTLFSCVRLWRGRPPNAEFCTLELDPTYPAQRAPLSRGVHTNAGSSRTGSHAPCVCAGLGLSHSSWAFRILASAPGLYLATARGCAISSSSLSRSTAQREHGHITKLRPGFWPSLIAYTSWTWFFPSVKQGIGLDLHYKTFWQVPIKWCKARGAYVISALPDMAPHREPGPRRQQ